MAGLAGCVTTTDPTPPGAFSTADTGCRVTYIADGDTIHMACPGTGEVKARLLGFDTPEVYSPGCTAELAAGQQATVILRQILRSGPITAARFEGHDRYGRELVRLEVGGQDVAGKMIASGFAVPYSGGRSPDWCRML
jgi:endonuclease YncB( thermonuclease family)